MEHQQGIEHLTQSQLAQEGIFRAYPIAWTIEESKEPNSKSVGIAIRFAIFQEWSAQHKAWSEEWPTGYYVDGRSYVVGKDGNVNQGAVSALAKAGLWDGDWEKLTGQPPNVFVHVDVKNEPYQNQDRFRAKWINPDAEEPAARGGFAPVDDSLLASLRSRFQSSTRAIAGGKPSGAPGVPPHAAPAPAIQPAGQPAAAPARPPASAPQQPAAGPGPRPPATRPASPPMQPASQQAAQGRPPARPPAGPPARPAGPPARSAGPTPAIQQPAAQEQEPAAEYDEPPPGSIDDTPF